MSSFVPIYAVDFDGTLCESKWPGIGNDDGGSLQRQAVGTHYGADDLMSFGLRPGRSRHPREEYGENQPEP